MIFISLSFDSYFQRVTVTFLMQSKFIANHYIVFAIQIYDIFFTIELEMDSE